jgi:hypothetical protein
MCANSKETDADPYSADFDDAMRELIAGMARGVVLSG